MYKYVIYSLDILERDLNLDKNHVYKFYGSGIKRGERLGTYENMIYLLYCNFLLYFTDNCT